MEEFEPHEVHHTVKLNWLRAAVLGANDGIVSIGALIFGIAGATNSDPIILTTGIAGTIAGSLSMGVGEYVSVSSSRDTERALLEKERIELKNSPDKELAELVVLYERKGLSRATATTVAQELTARDAFAAHVDAELRMDPDNLTNPSHAAIASTLSFIGGAIVPLLAMILPPASIRIPTAFVAVLLILAVTGALSARVGGANVPRAVVRVVFGGALAMAITYLVGLLFGITVL